MDSFKGNLSAPEVCEIISSAIKEKSPSTQVVLKPIADGGEGTADAMLKSISGKWIQKTVTGPLFDMKVNAGFAWFEESRTALVEMASAAGLQLLKKEDEKKYDKLVNTLFRSYTDYNLSLRDYRRTKRKLLKTL